MAYSASGLTLIGGSSAQRMWIYTSADTIADINTEDYFLEAIDMINKNDVMFIVSSTGGTPVISTAYCNQSDGTNIDIVNGVAVTATDSD